MVYNDIGIFSETINYYNLYKYKYKYNNCEQYTYV